MCGRYASTRSTADLSAMFEAVDETGPGQPVPSYNVAPTDYVPIVRRRRSATDGGRVISAARWGLVPHWARDPRIGARMINARAETLATSTAYAPSFAARRCLVPADGWYEWTPLPGPLRSPGATPLPGAPRLPGGGAGSRRGGARQAYFLTPRDGAPLAFAGLCARAGDLLSCTIVTMAATGALAGVHDRMPFVLPPAWWERWLDGPADPALLQTPPPAEVLAGLEIRPVGPAVGDVRNDGPHLVARIEAAATGRIAHRGSDPTLF
ncbi:MAG TPA: SOS response-associated peptidase [Micromonosporaceae bacterium]|nr:SOS response-associated peptidase [Micromonosporaceae bacterium]